MALIAQDQTPGDLDSLPLLPVQRRQHIVDFLHRHGAVTLQQLATALRVS